MVDGEIRQHRSLKIFPKLQVLKLVPSPWVTAADPRHLDAFEQLLTTIMEAWNNNMKEDFFGWRSWETSWRQRPTTSGHSSRHRALFLMLLKYFILWRKGGSACVEKNLMACSPSDDWIFNKLRFRKGDMKLIHKVGTIFIHDAHINCVYIQILHPATTPKVTTIPKTSVSWVPLHRKARHRV